MHYQNSLLELIGNTPLVRLKRVAAGLPATVLAKVEYLNPGGSVKDRIAVRMVEAAEADGRLRPGGTIIEPTSGNTGVGLAIVAQEKGYRCLFTCPDKVAADKIRVLRAYGATVVICPATVPVDDPRSYRSVAARLERETQGAVLLDQYSHPENPRSHYLGTGPELWRQTDGRITHFVAGIGTGGTISGAGAYLKKVSHGRVRIIGADPEGSIYSDPEGPVRPYLLEGVGQPQLPRSYDPTVPDEIIRVSDHEAITMTRRLAREEALLTGGSCGMAAVAALRVAERLTPDDLVVVLLPDSGRGYLAKIFDDQWVARLGLFDDPADTGPRLRELLPLSVERPRAIVLQPEVSLLRAATLLDHYPGGTHIVVTAGAPPLRLAEVVGLVAAHTLRDALTDPRRSAIDPISSVATVRPHVGAGQSASAAACHLDAHDAAVVIERGFVCGVVTGDELDDLTRADTARTSRETALETT
ncbi:cystathionine beta-synthase [Asanoa hainanensis]|uniref:Cystathionine beta-synthase n=1 Tax=Asanoa hainanensis TaxID=560556 RepID=A0A239P1D7_9ACTN|nr:pyridoxal-phosphate dependent enzyme [Asanoa hainanensis]SNT60951.1 cystathionine beta-synthase [Asanoa hainanensis]